MELGSTWVRDFVTHSTTTGAVTDADVMPEVRIFEDGQYDPMLYIPAVDQRGVLTGQYFVTIEATEANGFEKGKSYNAIAAAAVAGVTGKQPVDSFIIEDAMDKKTKVAAMVDIPVAESFVPVVDELTTEQPMGMELKFGASSDYVGREFFTQYYDVALKGWREGAPVDADIMAEVSAHQDLINTYDSDYAVWKAGYDLQRIIQWKAYVADQLIAATE